MKFDYGDEAVVVGDAGCESRADQPCAVVGMTSIETEEQINVFGHPVGTTTYTVEFGDGSDITIPEDLLKPLNS